MKCHTDKIELELIERNGVAGHNYNICQGLFISGKSINAFKFNFNSDVLTQLTPTKSKTSKQKPCPVCNQLMSIKSIEEIELDCCDLCGGIWFDPNELEQVTNNHSINSTD